MYRWITLLTDFGGSDPYVAVLKGVMIRIAPAATLIDITHGIAPQDVAAAAFCLGQAWRHFPPGTVHLAVVDPGVGGERRAIALEEGGSFFVGPDNGVFSAILTQAKGAAAVALTNRACWRTPTPSPTFHGRDVFAPAAAWIATGLPLSRLGDPVDPASLVRLAEPAWTAEEDVLTGSIQYMDGFGNLVTTIPGEAVAGGTWLVVWGKQAIPLGKTYGAVPAGGLLALTGSHGFVEIAASGGSARDFLRADRGMPVVLRRQR